MVYLLSDLLTIFKSHSRRWYIVILLQLWGLQPDAHNVPCDKITIYHCHWVSNNSHVTLNRLIFNQVSNWVSVTWLPVRLTPVSDGWGRLGVNQKPWVIIQSWSKILAPLHFCQIMHHFSQKIVAITNALVFMCFLCIGKTQKIWGKKHQIWLPHRTPKMDWPK